ncbi:MAG: restriction endonuclease subunit S [archaeon]
MQAYELEKTDADFIDEIPKHWNLNRAKKIYREVDERSTDGSEILLSVSEFTGVTPKQKKYEDADWVGRAESLEGYKKCKKGDLVSNIMLAWKRGLGVTEHNGIVSPAYCVYRSNHKAHPKYMHYLLRDVLYTTEFKRHSRGIIDSRLRLYSQYFLPIPLITPPVEEQEIIAKYLKELSSKINKVIKLKQQQIEKIEKYYSSVIYEIITKGKNKNNNFTTSKVPWINKYPSSWKIKRVKDVCLKIDTGSTPPTAVEEYYLDGEIKWFSPADFNKSKYLIEAKKLLNIKAKIDNKLKIFPENSIYFVGVGATVGKIALTKDASSCNQQINIITPFKIEPNYLYYFLKVYEKDIVKIATNTTLPIFNQRNTGELKIAVPSISEQKEISSYLDKVNKNISDLIQKINFQIETLKQYKESIIHECVMGKKCVLEVKNG